MQGRAFAQDGRQSAGPGLAGLLLAAAAEAEIVLGAAQVAEALQAVDEQVQRRDAAPAAPSAAAPPPRPPRPTAASHVAPAGRAHRLRQHRTDLSATPTCGLSTGVPSRTTKLRRRVLGRQARPAPRSTTPSAVSSCWPTISRLLPLCAGKSAAVGSLMAMASPSQASRRPRRLPARRARRADWCSRWFLPRRPATLPSKTIVRPRRDVAALPGQLADAVQVVLALLVGQPDDLEDVVALDQAVGVVVDRLAGPRQQPGRRVVLAQDQVGVGLAALQGDAHRHLVDGAAGQRVGAAQGLRAEQDVHAEGPALPHQAVQQQRRLLGDLVVLDEELLELVDDQQDARAAAVRPLACR